MTIAPATQGGSTHARAISHRPKVARTSRDQGDVHVQVHRHSAQWPGRISLIHHRATGIEYVVRLHGPDAGMGAVINVRTSSEHSTVLTGAADEQR